MISLFSRISKLDRLVEKYQAADSPAGNEISRVTIQIGSVRYRKCATLFISDNGLFVHIRVLWKKYPVIFIPYSDLNWMGESRLYGKSAAKFSIGEPPVTEVLFYDAHFRQFKSFLK